MPQYGGLSQEKVLEIHSFVMQKRKEEGKGQRKICVLVKEHFGIDLSENTIAGWIFQKNVPYANERTQFVAKPRPQKEELFEEYLLKKQSAEVLGKKYGVSTIIVIHWLKQYNLSPRTHLESMNTPLIKKQLAELRLRRPTKDFSLVTPEKSYILGVLCGDGHITKDFVSFEIGCDEDFIKEFARCFEEVYGLHYNYRHYKPKNTLILRVTNQLICKDLLGYGKFRTENWGVPKEIANSGDEKIIGRFLRGFYDSEGSTSSRSSISCSSINKEGLEQVKVLLKALGIESTLCSCQGGKYYVLHIFRKERFKLFRDKIGFTIQRKLDRLNQTLNTGFFSKRSAA